MEASSSAEDFGEETRSFVNDHRQNLISLHSHIVAVESLINMYSQDLPWLGPAKMLTRSLMTCYANCCKRYGVIIVEKEPRTLPEPEDKKKVHLEPIQVHVYTDEPKSKMVEKAGSGKFRQGLARKYRHHTRVSDRAVVKSNLRRLPRLSSSVERSPR